MKLALAFALFIVVGLVSATKDDDDWKSYKVLFISIKSLKSRFKFSFSSRRNTGRSSGRAKRRPGSATS